MSDPSGWQLAGMAEAALGRTVGASEALPRSLLAVRNHLGGSLGDGGELGIRWVRCGVALRCAPYHAARLQSASLVPARMG